MEQQTSREEEIDLLELISAMWMARVKIITYGVVAGIIGIVVAFSIPKVYTSHATMVPEMEGGSSTSSSFGSLASIAGINLGDGTSGITASVYPQIVSSTPFIFEFADMPVTVEQKIGADREVTLVEYFTKEYKSPWWSHVMGAPMKILGWGISLFKDIEEEGEGGIDLKKLTKDQALYKKNFSELITLSIDQKSNIISLGVNTQSPEVSLMLADSILVKLQEYMTLYKTSKLRYELESNQNMLAEAQKNYYYADSVYAASLDRTKNLASNVARISLERLQNEKNMTYQIYSQLATQVELNKTKLNAETPILTVIEPATLAIRASSPNKMMIIIAFGFLGGVVAVAPIFIGVLLPKRDDEEGQDEIEKNRI